MEQSGCWCLQVQPCWESLTEGETSHLYCRDQSGDRHRGLQLMRSSLTLGLRGEDIQDTSDLARSGEREQGTMYVFEGQTGPCPGKPGLRGRQGYALRELVN